jgi:hypothetical protein
MRFLGFRTHVLYALAASAGIVLSLGRTWYAPKPAVQAANDGTVGEMPSTISSYFDGVSRSLTSGDASGWQQLDTVGTFLLALAAILAVCALGTLVPACQRAAASGAQLAALLALATVFLEVVLHPGQAGVETRVGGCIALACAVVGFTAAMSLRAAPRRRRPAAAAAVGKNLLFEPAQGAAPVAVASPAARPVWDDGVPPIY